METPLLPLVGVLPALPLHLRSLVAEFVRAALDDEAVPAHMLALCRARLAQLHNLQPSVPLTADDLQELPCWQTSSRFSPADRACLALAEKLAWDWHSITDEEIAAARAALGSDAALVQVIVALALLDADCRVRLVLGDAGAGSVRGG